jgi:hypothetical protein
MYNKPMRSFRRETGLYLLALIIGLAVRLVSLGRLPLSDQEATWALQALGIANGTHPVLGSQPGYVVLTAALFFAFGGATNALARLLPALTGSALILVPSLFRERLRPRPAVILAFALALEPGLAALSRQAGSSILAVTFTLAAWGLWEKRRFAAAGICAGMALLSGPALWAGVLGLAIAWALLRPFEREATPTAKVRAGLTQRVQRRDWITAAVYAAGAIVLIGTLFMAVPGGLSAWIASLPDYISGWGRASDISIPVMLSSLLAYQPLGILLALVTIVRGWLQASPRVRRLSTWMVVALLLALFYPSRQVVDLGWMLIPLWALASLEAARSLNVHPSERREVLGAVALIGVLLVFVWLDYLALQRPGVLPDQALLRTWLLLGSLFLLGVSLLLVAVGWSARIARFGAVWGLAAFLGVYSFGALMAASGIRNVPNGAEMWSPGAQLPMAELLQRSVRDQSSWSDIDPDSQSVTIAGIDSPALQWMLRDRPVEVRASAGAAAGSPMVITGDQQDPALTATYRGQSFVWRSTPLWSWAAFPEWLPFHEAAHQDEAIILWVRNDLFPDAKPSGTP